jgi:magnesium chelatase subunit D
MRRAPQRLPDSDAATAALILAVDPHGLGGAILSGMPGLVRDRWLEQFRALLPAEAPWRKIPVNVGEDRLLGGLDFAATLACGRPVFATGLLEASAGGIVLLSMAERASPSTAALIGGVLERGELRIERDGVARSAPSRFGVIALDESIDDEAGVADGLAERLAFRLRLADLNVGELSLGGWRAGDVLAARQRLGSIKVAEGVVERLCQTAALFGIASARGELFALRAARALAALLDLASVGDDEAAIGARLVLPQRATRLPPADTDNDETAQPPPPDPDDADGRRNSADIPDDVLVDAVRAALPDGLLALLQQQGARRRSRAGGRAGPRAVSRRRGRPVGVRPAESLAGARLNVLATLKAAIPWQPLRGRSLESGDAALRLRKEDLRVTRFEDSQEATTVFVVDASGSQAARRLAEVKGAIELLLNDCYVRRDQVALIAFRGAEAEVLLSPTRALARAKRSLAALPGGGGTPLASGLDVARELAGSIAHHGRVPAIVLMTDGRANIARDGKADIGRAEDDALTAARELNIEGFRSLLVDTARRPKPRAKALADAMGAHYVPLPRADAATLSATVQAYAA